MASTTLVPEPVSQPDSAAPGALLHRFTVEEYHRLPPLGEAGAARTELLDGWVIDMPPIGPTHSSMVEDSGDVVRPLLPIGWRLRLQQPVSFPTSEPQPDLAVVKGKRGDYRKRHPGPQEIGLLVEVSDTTLAFDRAFRAVLYAAANVPYYWIINVIDRQLEVHRDPRPAADGQAAYYAVREVLRAGDTVPLILDGQTIAAMAAAELLP